MNLGRSTRKNKASLSEMITPCLLLDKEQMCRNIARLSDRIGLLGGSIRPHVKTHKSVDVAREVVAGGNVDGITVSTLKEAAYFFLHGFDDILYAVGIAPNKFAAVEELICSGCDLKITLYSEDMANRLANFAATTEVTFKVLIELDTGGHRSGVDPRGDELLCIGRILASSAGCELNGVMAHAGESYRCDTAQDRLSVAKRERDLSVMAAERLRGHGIPCPVVSVGSTPTAFAIDDLTGVTEVRAGVYTFFDLVMSGIGVCDVDEIAVSVLVSVTGHQKDKGWVITDGGWMAMSSDRGTAGQAVDQGYGLVLDVHGNTLHGYIVSGANQEHGIISAATGKQIDYSKFPLGAMLRILPNHACATVAQFNSINVIGEDSVSEVWERVSGW